jgi:uncharacterized membrane protein
MNTIFFKSVMGIHVLCGAVSLITGCIAMIVKKGGKTHNLAGIIFYWAMFYIFVSTIIFLVLDPMNLKYQFFLGIGIVSFYPNWSGKRMLTMKKEFKPMLIDKIGAYLIGISGLGMIAYGTFLAINPSPDFGGLHILFFIFGTVSLLNSYGDLKIYLGYIEPIKMHWFFAHGGKMIGAYSAAMTAFCVNIVPRFLPKNTPDFVQIMTWVIPGVTIGIIGRVIIKRFKVKFSK